ncbi:(Protein-PII) uridylyltransferase [Desulfamplus magnetovallimortis]|uniref:Bifunctional uridylyltransferase/uridylyl-removing enzyme n=1 Tax=Desulfamplus magnetovallimortis TaxID=1246637 RepID=A0A1W1HB74_9BACT|nr:[protein-PII] uridylyltransferase [Desulfamplus magnetovallimortis]SLM29737.1 (Protein-PII) uridylyltransferase [Desulfamplus magnetovallimortis]
MYDYKIENQKSGISGQLFHKKEELVKHFFETKSFNFLESYTRLLDEYFHDVVAESDTARKMTAAGTPVAIVALGGYGRGEQCVHSDVDLLILFEKKVPVTTDELVKELLYPLWDARLETGYAVRTVKECLVMAWEEFDILTTMLDARFICGSSPVFFQLMEKFRNRLSRKYVQKSLSRLIEESRKRYQDYGDSTYLLEPNLKSGHGGLRDYHTIVWYARIMSDIKCRRDLERYGFLSHDEFTTLEHSLEFIWYIRNVLHHLTGRKCDQLHFEHQKEASSRLGFRGRDTHQAVERFMGELHSKMDYIKQINLMITEDIQLTRKARFFTGMQKSTNYNGIVVRQRRLEFESMEMVPSTPELLLQIFVESGRLQIPLSVEARRIVGEFAYLVDDAFRRKTSNVEAFEKIVASSFWEFNVLNVMLSTGLLVRFMPEFGSILNKIQYNQYHLFPVDKHSIRCVQVINGFKGKKVDPAHEFYSTVYRELKNRRTLLLAALLHDIGKGDPGSEHSLRGAEIARKIMNRSGYCNADVDEVEFLVRNHLFLVKIATRRDISDEETSIFCATKIQKIGVLRKLYLLTVADSMATGPKAWNEWTETLLRDLFLKTAGIIKNRELATRKASQVIHKKRDDLVTLSRNEGFEESNLLKMVNSLNHRYLLYISPGDMVEHLKLYRDFKLKDNDFIWKITTEKKSDIRTVTICGKDRPGFYSKLAGVFFLNGLNIVGSQAYAFMDNCALDIFKVMPPRDRIFENEKWKKAENELHQALADDSFLEKLKGKLPVSLAPVSGRAVMPNRVKVDNESSSFFTIVEVFTYDFPGLLFVITNILYRLGLDVRVAMVATKIDQVVDVFYVRSVDNGKIDDPEDENHLQKSILAALPPVREPLPV